jgi:alpha-tubulin suppressor-like RCC1 family protein
MMPKTPNTIIVFILVTISLTSCCLPKNVSSTAIAAGENHACALTSSGEIKCWGHNIAGELGDGTTEQRRTPVDVSGLNSGVIAIAAGGRHTCALMSSGGVKCWGRDYASDPVDVLGLDSSVITVAVGKNHACALTDSGGVKCWGSNTFGQLGISREDLGSSRSGTPVNAGGLSSSAIAIAVGEDHTCALVGGGGAKCWGLNDKSQLGNGTIGRGNNSPVDVIGLDSDVIAIAAGQKHTCALTSSGGVKCWGWNEWGQLGDGSTSDSSTPVNVIGLDSDVTAITAGEQHTCALMTSGGVKCWGWDNAGQLGSGPPELAYPHSTTPIDVSELNDDVIAIAAGSLHTCALMGNGAVKCWGLNVQGQLGNNTVDGNSRIPVDVIGLDGGG